jgi:hypothetical protein
LNVNNDKIILLNGKKECGKDTIIDYFQSTTNLLIARAECKDHLHKLTQLFFCLTEDRYWEIYEDRRLKEKPLPEFRISIFHGEAFNLAKIIGEFYEDSQTDYRDTDCDTVDGHLRYTTNLSHREAMIYVSEIICKPRFGQDYFGKARIKLIQDRTADADEVAWKGKRDSILWFDGSAAFVEEIPPLLEHFNQDQILLLRIRRGEDDFGGDSRSFLPNGLIENTVDIYNDGTLEQYLEEVEGVVSEFLRGSDE